MAKQKTHSITSRIGKPPGMNYADFLRWKDMLYKDALEQATSTLQRVISDRQSQRVSWLYTVALNERYSFAEKRMDDLEGDVKELAAEYAKMVEEFDQDYADEVLRRRVSKIRNKEMQWIHSDELPVNKVLSAEEIAALRESDGRIY